MISCETIRCLNIRSTAFRRRPERRLKSNSDIRSLLCRLYSFKAQIYPFSNDTVNKRPASKNLRCIQQPETKKFKKRNKHTG